MLSFGQSWQGKESIGGKTVGETSAEAELETSLERASAFDALTPQQASLLDDENRRRIVGLLWQMPGMNKNQIGKALDLFRNTVQHHITRLERAGLVKTLPSAQENERLCFLAADAHLWEEETTRILYGRSPNRHAAIYVAENPGCTAQDIAEAIDREDVTALHHLRTLRKHGLVEGVREGFIISYFPTSALKVWYRTVGEGYSRPWTGEESETEGSA